MRSPGFHPQCLDAYLDGELPCSDCELEGIEEMLDEYLDALDAPHARQLRLLVNGPDDEEDDEPSEDEMPAVTGTEETIGILPTPIVTNR